MASKHEQGAETATVGRGAKIAGRVSGDGDLVVEGRIEGEVTVSGDLTLLPGSVVEAPVNAADVTIDGAIVGDVHARGAVVLRASGSVQGAITTNRLALEEGARFSGRIEMNVELPAELQAAARG
jgi:cytoskeletal protein CcmA (bactofilin family)